MAAADLYDLCKALLDASAEAVALSPGGEIDRRFVSPGLPAFDCCPQLTVHAGGPQWGDTAPLQPPLQPGHRVDEGRALNLVTVTVTVIRCVPGLEEQGQTVRLPTAASLDESSKATLGDCWAIWNHLYTRKLDLTLFPPRTREMFFDPAVPVSIAGGCAGWMLQFRVQLGGYRTVAP